MLSKTRAKLRKTKSYGLVRTATAFVAILPFVTIALWQSLHDSSANGFGAHQLQGQRSLSSTISSANGTLAPGKHCHIPVVADPAQITHPAGSILYLIGVAFAFVGISIVCEEHFAKALEEIIDKVDSKSGLEIRALASVLSRIPSIHATRAPLVVSADLAAVLILAPGSSAPEFVAGMLSMFVADTNSVGTGTILGSAVL